MIRKSILAAVAKADKYACYQHHELWIQWQQDISEIPILFFLLFFVYFSYQRQGDIRCYQGFQRDGEI